MWKYVGISAAAFVGGVYANQHTALTIPNLRTFKAESQGKIATQVSLLLTDINMNSFPVNFSNFYLYTLRTFTERNYGAKKSDPGSFSATQAHKDNGVETGSATIVI